MPAGGCVWPAAAGSAPARRTRSSGRSSGSKVRAGGCATRCRGAGEENIDSVAIAPTGVAFAIETKTRTFDARHLAGVREMALWLHGRRRRWSRRGALPVLCVVRARGLECVEGGVLIVSLDRLVPALRVAAGLSKRPGVPGRHVSDPAGPRHLGALSRAVAHAGAVGEFARSTCRELGDSLLDAAHRLHPLFDAFRDLGLLAGHSTPCF
jgi:hypothetical protein